MSSSPAELRSRDQSWELLKQQDPGCQGRESCRGSPEVCWACIHLLGAAVTKCHKLSGLNNRNLFSHGSRGWKSEIRSQQPSEGYLFHASPMASGGLLSVFDIPWQQLYHLDLFLHLHMGFSPCTCLCVQFPLFMRTFIMLDQDAPSDIILF